MPRRFLTRGPVAVAVLLPLLAAAAPVAAAPVATADTRATAATPDPSAVTWSECATVIGVPLDPAIADCTRLVVPLDHSGRIPGTTSVAMLRRKATDPAHRRGSLFVNPGGPGVSGLHIAYRAERLLPPMVVSQYDIIGFDPRGVGQSAPVKCFRSQEEYQATFGDRLTAPVTASEIDRRLAADRAYSQACASLAGPLLAQVSTAAVARDLDLMRQAVGEDRLDFVGLSYGTLLGATYRNLFPHRTGALILDGNVDPELRSRDGLKYDRRRAGGFERVLDAFLRACAAAPTCAFGDDPQARSRAIRDRLRAGPLTLPGGEVVTYSTWVGRLADELGTASALPGLARALAELDQVVRGVSVEQSTAARDFAVATGPAAEAAQTPYRLDDSEYAVNCLDKPYPRRPERLPALADRWEQRFPTFGRMTAFEGAACASWPVSGRTARYSGPWNTPSARPPLVIGNRHDPVTQFAFAVRMAAELDRARLVRVDQFGHTALGLNRCTDALVASYLLEDRLPPRVSSCPADEPLFPPGARFSRPAARTGTPGS